jgi:hypothetical protein
MEAFVFGETVAMCRPDLFAGDKIFGILHPPIRQQVCRRKKYDKGQRFYSIEESRRVRRRTLGHSSQVSLEAKRNALEAIAQAGIATGGAQNWAQSK